MKKLSIIIIIIIFMFFPLYSLTLTKIVEFPLQNLKMEKKDGFICLKFQGAISDWKPGAPDLPYIPYEIVLPPNSVIENISVIPQDSITLSLFLPLYPVQKPTPLSSPLPPIFTPPDKHLYGLPQYPEFYYRVSWGKIGKFTALNLIFSPVIYRPLDHSIVIYKKIKVIVNYKVLSKFMESFSGFDYLIITADSLKPYFDKLKRWKLKKGLNTKIRTIEWINANYSGRDIQERIRNYIKEVVKDSGVTWVLLGGDTDIIPDRKAFAMPCSAFYHPREDSLPADLYYADIDGSWDEDNDGIFGELEDSIDLYPDVFIGRAPVRTGEEAETFVNKLITYETCPDTTYQKDFLFLGEILWNNPYTDGGIGKDRIDSLWIPDGYNITKLYQSRGNENPTSVIREIEKGKGLINHDGHGWINIMSVGEGYLRNEDMLSLRNSSKYGVIFSIGCWTGAFDYDCIGEAFVRNPNGGGVGYIGNSSYGWGSPGNPGFGYSDVFDERFYKEIFEESRRHIGEALAFTKASFIPFSYQKNVYRWHQYQLNLLGDPEMVIWLNNPATMEVMTSDSITTDQLLHIYVEHEEVPLSNVTVTLTTDDSIYTKVTTNDFGEAEIEIKEDFPEEMYITCTKFDFLPVIKTIKIIHKDVYLSYSFPSFNDEHGNDDGYVNPADTVLVSFYLKNSGITNAYNIDLNLIARNNRLIIIDSTEKIEEVKAKDSLFIKDCFKVYIPDSMESSALCTLRVKVQDHIWKYPFIIPLHTPDVSFSNIRIEIPDEYITPGSSGNFIFYVVNRGSGVFYNGTVQIIPLTEGVNFGNKEFNLPSIFPKDSIQMETLIFVSSNAHEGDLLKFKIVVENDKTYYEEIVQFVVGKTGFTEDFEDPFEGWESYGTPDLWHRTTADKNSGSYSLYCGREDKQQYEDNMNNSIVSPEFFIPVEPVLELYRKFEFPLYGTDGLYIELLHGEKIDTLDFLGTGGALEIKDEWMPVYYELKGTVPGEKARLRFTFVSDGSDVAKGVFIDDIKVYGRELFKTTGIEENKDLKIYIEFTGSNYFYVYLPEDKEVSIILYDCTGRHVSTLFKGYLKKGTHKFLWNQLDRNGKKVSVGIYFVIVKTKDKKLQGTKLLLIP